MNKLAPFLFLTLVVGACSNDLNKTSSGGKKCKDSSGALVTVDEIFGQWKKVDGYIDSRDLSSTNLALNYSVLIIEKGTTNSMCQVEVKDGAAQALISNSVDSYVATKSHDVMNKVLNISYTFGANGARSDVVNYAFGGDCSAPAMTFSYPNNSALSQEDFVLQTKNVPAGSCNPSQ